MNPTNPQPERWRLILVAAIAIIAGGAALFGYLGAEEQAEQTDRYYYRSSAGNVLFAHTGHQDTADCEMCHHEMEQGAEELQSCRACHPAAAPEDPPFLGCQDCHEDPEYDAEYADHEDLLAIHDPDCENCHAARAVAEAYHRNCSDCHLEVAPERFGDDQGQASCQACHLN